MNKLAVYIRIAKPEPTDGDVESRQAAVNTLVESWKLNTDLRDLISRAGELAGALHADSLPSSRLGSEVEAAIQPHSASYVYTEYPLEVGICAAVAAGKLVQPDRDWVGTTRIDFFAAALWSALAYQVPVKDGRRETLRRDLMEACRVRTMWAAKLARERLDVPDIDDGEDEDGSVTFREAATEAIENLKHNAVMDREELDVMWWAQLRRSRLLAKSLDKLDEPVGLVACAIEAAQLLKALPAEVHRDLVLRTVDVDPELHHIGLLEILGADRPKLAAVYAASDIVQSYPTVFPILHSLKVGHEPEDENSRSARPASEWAERALLESCLARLYHDDLVLS
ncbi:GTPase-associated system all-helical protein GASH [uncultured Pseudacidovorax sp.]|uniref:GTPase-associated system all-helical protein GASH n=1 Tax=uncultured Pseudacidovorax sp. TaxID=679313 RepID=UPI0025F30F77|nr:GTPase-associated system all-helical protein GASH [uncultured Pseudacidovorax sp.]